MTLLAIENLSVSLRQTRVLDGVNLELGAGEIVALVGTSGAGKSMTALAVMGLLPRQARAAGVVRLGDRTLTGLPETELERIRGRDIGMVFQEPASALNPLMRVGAQVAETILIHRRTSAREARRSAAATLAEVGLGDIPDIAARLPYQLSGGQRQRAAIAAAVALSPRLLIADEPTASLDPVAQARVLDLLAGLVRSRRMALLLVTHDLAVVARIADRIALMYEGRIVEQCSPAELGSHASHPYGAALKAAASWRRPREGREKAASPVTVVEARGIVHEYRRPGGWAGGRGAPHRALDDVSIRVGRGEIVGLVGESGSGKSTLLRILLALDRPQSGEVRLLDQSFSQARGADLRRLRRSIQAVFQDPSGSLDPRWTVERVIAEPLHLLEGTLQAPERRSRVQEALRQVGLAPDAAMRLPREFSGGQRQRIALARALITRPAVIALDEAFSALDVQTRVQILELLVGLAASLDLAYLLVSHDLNVVRSVADRVYVLRRGRIVEEGPTESVLGAPREPYTKTLVAASFT